MAKIITADQAAELIGDGMTVAFGTMGLAGWAEEVARAVERRFLETGHPKDLNVVQGSNAGDRAERGITRWGHEGLIKRWTGAHIGFCRAFAGSRGITKSMLTASRMAKSSTSGGYRRWKPGMQSHVGLGPLSIPG
jgi:acyl CoA:acetate/3-ketoacid CoA transferase